MKFRSNSLSTRILAFMLTFGMVFSTCPISAIAADEDYATTDEVIETVIDVDDETSEETTEATEESVEDVDVATTEETVIDEVTEETTDEVTEDVNSDDVLVEFNHYYSNINDNDVTTTDLFVQTNDASVFTKNTNVISNYDNVYIIACTSVEEARYTYSYYVDKVEHITDMSNVMTLSTEDNEEDVADLSNINEGTDPLSVLNDTDARKSVGYVALLDTGADADIKYSIVENDTIDKNGHGQQMYNYMKEENPDIKVMSIKIFDGNKTTAADVYAGIMLAVESKVSIINLSFVGPNVEKNAIVKEAIKVALDNNITVVGAAGNYNSNAKSFIPGCIQDVITVGAANEDGTKYASSNYNADKYVVATSTSEATARYSAMLTNSSEINNDRVFDEVKVTDNEENEIDDWDLAFNYNYGGITTNVQGGQQVNPYLLTDMPFNPQNIANNGSYFSFPATDENRTANVKKDCGIATARAIRSNAAFYGFNSTDLTYCPDNGSNWAPSFFSHFTSDAGNHKLKVVFNSKSTADFVTFVKINADGTLNQNGAYVGINTSNETAIREYFKTIGWTPCAGDIIQCFDGNGNQSHVMVMGPNGLISTGNSGKGAINGRSTLGGEWWDDDPYKQGNTYNYFYHWFLNSDSSSKQIYSFKVYRAANVTPHKYYVDVKKTVNNDSLKSTINDGTRCDFKVEWKDGDTWTDYGWIELYYNASTQSWDRWYWTPNEKYSATKENLYFNKGDIGRITETGVYVPDKPLTEFTDRNSFLGDDNYTNKTKSSVLKVGSPSSWTFTAGDDVSGTGISYNSSTYMITFTAQNDFEETKVQLTKAVESSYASLVAGNPNYSLTGTTYKIYAAASNNVVDESTYLCTLTVDATGKSNIATLPATYSGKTVYAKETTAGKGYKVSTGLIPVTIGAPGSVTSFTAYDRPIGDPNIIKLSKISNKTNSSAFNGTSYANNAEYTVTQYYNATDAFNKTNAVKTIVYSTRNNNTISLLDDSAIVSGTQYANHAWPISVYRIQETKAPSTNGVDTGLELSKSVYYMVIDANNRTVYKDDNGTATSFAQCTIVNSAVITDYAEANQTLLNATESEVWLKLGLLKVDAETKQPIAQANFTFEGAQYSVYTRDASIFKISNIDGHTYSVNGNGAVIVDGQPLVITIGSDGYGETSVALPYGDCYYVMETKAPYGYLATSGQLNITKEWVSGTDAKTIIGFTLPDGTKKDVATLANFADGTVYEKEVPIRSDFGFYKLTSDGEAMPYVPFLVSLVDEDGTVVEQHVIMTDANGAVTTRKAKSADTVNKLDQYYVDGRFNDAGWTTAQYEEAAAGNIWFGAISDYTRTENGSLFMGHYLLEEIPSNMNKGTNMEHDSFDVTSANFVSLSRTIIDLPILMTSNALEENLSVNTIGFADYTIIDNVDINNLKIDSQYKLVTKAVYTDANGETHTLGVSDDHIFTPAAVGNSKTTKYKVLMKVAVDSSNLEPGTRIEIIDELYMKINGNWTVYPIITHNEDFDADNQTIWTPTLSTDAVNTTTNSHIGSIDPESNLTDVITYEHLGDFASYNFNIKLVNDANEIVKDADNNDCVRNITVFTTDTVDDFSVKNNMIVGPTSGTFSFADLGIDPFKIDTTVNENVHFVVTITDWDDRLVISHNTDLSDNLEAIGWINISTTASSNTGVEGIIPNDTESAIVDIISYENCIEETKVLIKGKVLETESLEEVTKAEKLITLPVGDGQVEMTFEFDSTPYAGKDLVVLEYIYVVVDGKEVLISSHDDITDTKQTVKVPKIETSLKNEHKGTGYKVISTTVEDVTLVDTVTYTNVLPNTEWKLTATLMSKSTNTPVVDADGKEVTREVIFTPTEKNGTIDVPITFKQVVTGYDWEEDESWVCFEDLKYNKPGHESYSFAVHNDINDEDQTNYIPKFRTVAADENGSKQIPALPNQTITDTVEFKNFAKAVEEGDIFTLKVKAVDAKTGEDIVDADGNVYTAIKTFVWNGQQFETIELSIDASQLKGKTIVFFESLYFGESTDDEDKVLVEDNLDNAEQTIVIPEIHTNAKDTKTNSETVSLDRVIVDTITINRVAPDTDYTITTKVVDKATGEFIKDAEGNDFVVVTNYHSPLSSADALVCEHCGKVYAVDDEYDVTIDLSKIDSLEGKDLVVYEYMTLNGVFVAEHEDITDLDQTVEVPEIHTTFIDVTTDDHVVAYGEDVKVVDTVTYSNLLEGKTYSMVCNLMDKNADAPFVDANGNPVTKTVTFEADKNGEGVVEVEFIVDSTLIPGKQLVAFEECFIDDVAVAIHADIDDAGQTVKVPEIQTTLKDKLIDEHMTHYGKEITVTDTVTYVNLTEGKKYVMTGTLMNKETNEPILDEDGNAITVSKEFVAGKDGDTVEIEFTIDSVKLAGTHIVAFEECTYNDILVAIHADIDDEDQTTIVPDIHTTLTDKFSGEHMTSYHEAKENDVTTVYTILEDKVVYTNLIVGKKYVMNGKLMNKETGKALVDANGKEVTSSVEFVPTESNGYVIVPFTIDPVFFKNTTIVAFESCDLDKVAVAIHEDLEDVNQTVIVPEARTTAVDKADGDHILDGTKTEQTIIDTVYYKNLEVGKEYTVVGKVVVKRTGDYVTDKDGNIVTATVTFTAEKSEGTIEVPITIDASRYAGEKLVCFESVRYNNVELAVHADIEDDDQTLTTSLLLHVKIAKVDADNNTHYLEGAEITVYEDKECTKIAKDIDGNDCVGITNKDGYVEFTILTYDVETVLYAKETKAPFGFKINNDVFEIHPDTDRSKDEAEGTCLIEMKIADFAIVIPPKTGDSPVLPIMIFSIIGMLCVGAYFMLKPKKQYVEYKKSNKEELDD